MFSYYFIILKLKDRLKKIAQMSGLHDDITLNGLNEEFLDDDWDPEKHEVSCPI